MIDLPDIRSVPGDCPSIACLYAVCDYYGVEPHAGGAFEKSLETAQRRSLRTDEVTAAAVDLGLPVAYAGQMTLPELRGAVEGGRPVVCVVKSHDGEAHYVVAAGRSEDRLLVNDPWRGPLALPPAVWLSVWGGGGMVLDGLRIEKAQHGGRGGGMVPDRFQSLQHPMPKGSTVTAREAVFEYAPGEGFKFEAYAGDKLEVLDHRGGEGTKQPAEVLVRNKAGQEAWIGRTKLRGKTTGRGHKLPAPTGREEPYHRQPAPKEEPAKKEPEPASEGAEVSTEHPKRGEGWRHGGGTCKPGQTAAQTHCSPSRN